MYNIITSCNLIARKIKNRRLWWKKSFEIKNLSFSYKDQKVLSDLSFDVYKGDYFGILGPNGSGKTTLLKLCLGLISSKGNDKILVKIYKDTEQKNKNILYITKIKCF